MLFHVFDNHDGIVHYKPDGQHHGEEGQSINGEIKDDEGGKGAYDGNWHRQHGDEGGAPFLEEYEYHQDNQQQGLHEGVLHFADGCIDEAGVIHDDDVVQIRREAVPGLLQHLFHLADGIQGVGVVGELYAEADTGFTVDFGVAAFVLGACLDFGYVLQVHELAVGRGFQDNISKLLRRGETAFHLGTVLLFLGVRRRLAADGTGGGGNILFLNGRNHIGHGEISFRQLIRIQPHPHGVAGAEGIYVAHAVDALDFVQKVNVGVVFQKGLVIGALRRIKVGHEHHVTGGLAHRKARGLHIAWQAVLGQVRIVLHVHGVRIAVTVKVEHNGQAVGTVVAGGGGHVGHILQPVQLLFNHLGHRLVHNGSIGAGIGGAQTDGGR